MSNIYGYFSSQLLSSISIYNNNWPGDIKLLIIIIHNNYYYMKLITTNYPSITQ